MSNRKTLFDMSDDELFENCRSNVEHTEFGYNAYHSEIARRTVDKNTRALFWLTVVIGALTLVATIATVIKVMN